MQKSKSLTRKIVSLRCRRCAPNKRSTRIKAFSLPVARFSSLHLSVRILFLELSFSILRLVSFFSLALSPFHVRAHKCQTDLIVSDDIDPKLAQNFTLLTSLDFSLFYLYSLYIIIYLYISLYILLLSVYILVYLNFTIDK